MFKVRLAGSDDINFIYSTWLRSYKHDSPITKFIKREAFFSGHQKLLDQILANDTVSVIIACDEEDEGVIYGYMVYEPGIIHFIYVKEAFRKMGIARKMWEESGCNDTEKASHISYSLLDLWTKKKTTIEYDPYWRERWK